MKKSLFALIFVCLSMAANSQTDSTSTRSYQNIADQLLSTSGRLTIGGYGEVHYNQPFDSKIRSNGSLDVHRMVMLFGYNFSSSTQFVSEIEFEHVSEVYVEQAFLQHRLTSFANLRVGLMLIPMGIINGYHEPTTFNGVERPTVDNKIAPSTWREIGIGLAGNILPTTMRYQFYVVNGFNGYNGKGTLNGKNGLRSGRQKGAESFLSSANLSGKIEYYGIKSLNIGLSGYFGKTQSTLYNGIERDNKAAVARADSSVVGIAMVGIDGRYTNRGLQLRGQYYYTKLSNTGQYNKFTKGDLGSAMLGYYLEAGYNVFRLVPQLKTELMPFVRYELYDTHHATSGLIQDNKLYNNQVITAGLTFKLVKGAVLKTDVQFTKTETVSQYAKVFNAGFGIMF